MMTMTMTMKMSKNVALLPCCALVMMLMFVLATCDLQQDKQKCESPVLGMATCLPFVSGQARAPPMDCCTGFNQVLVNNPECVCLLIKDRNDPNLGLNINATLALSLPTRCKTQANRTVTDCPAILHLPPNSPDAKVFEDFASSGNKTNATPPSSEIKGNSGTMMPSTSTARSSTNQSSDGWRRKTIWLNGNDEMVSIIILLAMVVIPIFFINI